MFVGSFLRTVRGWNGAGWFQKPLLARLSKRPALVDPLFDRTFQQADVHSCSSLREQAKTFQRNSWAVVGFWCVTLRSL